MTTNFNRDPQADVQRYKRDIKSSVKNLHRQSITQERHTDEILCRWYRTKS